MACTHIPRAWNSCMVVTVRVSIRVSAEVRVRFSARVARVRVRTLLLS